MSSATAEEYGLKMTWAPFGFFIKGIGGSSAAQIATVKEFNIAGVKIKNLQFLAGGSQITGYDGLLGQNFLQKFDVEYDFANGAIRLFLTEACDNVILAYWLKPGQDYSAMHIDAIDPANPHTMGVAYLNGKEIHVTFDTGAFTSILSDKAAARAGVKTDSPGVTEAGYSRGLGRGQVKTYIARFDSFRIGDSEEIKNAPLRFADLDAAFGDMLLGADFFVSHHIFVANHEHRLFLSYNGGPVFDLARKGGPENAGREKGGQANGAPASGDALTEPAPGPDAPAQAATATPASAADAAVIARRGAASAARRDFAHALSDLTKAIELEPDEPEYYFERANAYLGNRQADLALADFDRAIELKNDFLAAYLPRAAIHLQRNDKPAAMADFATLDRLAAPQADARLALAQLYSRVQEYSPAIAQYDLWIKNHPDDARMLNALGGRCLASALQDQDLDGGRKDCDRSIHLADKRNPANARLYANRGLLLLRQGDYRHAVEDFDTDLKIEPKNARALYGRGVAEARLNKRAESDRDIAAAAALAPKIAEEFGHFGIGP
jgi:tetratricopeptide (TPR) repeat protein/predicted aspartyl protease